jgi:hypothetical protein
VFAELTRWLGQSAKTFRLPFPYLQLLPRPKRHDPLGGDLDLLACLRIAPRALLLLAQLKVTKTGQPDLLATLQGLADLLDLYPARVCEAASNHRRLLKKPPKTVDEYLDTLLKQGLTQTVGVLREWKRAI